MGGEGAAAVDAAERSKDPVSAAAAESYRTTQSLPSHCKRTALHRTTAR